MTTREKWIALAEKCAKASEADRVLDGHIAYAIDLRQKANGSEPYGWRNYVRGFPDMAEAVNAGLYYACIWRAELPRYTHSLDAIVGMIVKRWSVYSMAHYGKDGAYGTIFVAPNKPVNSPKCASPALALCTAFCLAMARLAE